MSFMKDNVHNINVTFARYNLKYVHKNICSHHFTVTFYFDAQNVESILNIHHPRCTGRVNFIGL